MKNKLAAFLVLLGITFFSSAFATQSMSNFYLPPHGHTIITRAIDGSSFETEDGTQWRTAEGYEKEVLLWETPQQLSITPNRSWIQKGTYYIYNKIRGTYVEASLSLGPVLGGIVTKRVVKIEYGRGDVTVMDGMNTEFSFYIDPRDRLYIQDWASNHAIIIGQNNEWFSSFDKILINVERNRYVRAKQF